MKTARFQTDAWSQGNTLKATEKTGDGFAEMIINLETKGLLFQYSPNTQFIFSNQKRADGILFKQEEGSDWSVTLIELKKQVTFGKWPQIKQQWHGAWLHALAIAGVLEISLTEKVQCVVGYRTEKLGQNNPDPILLKAHSGSQSTLREWETNSAELHELGQVQFMPVQLDENGYGEVAI